ncbi:MAG TPA: hypothetical protein VEJ63_05860 [Planctomycetota bacterium]|nr:hypothetical protein [Planctomycetota bacterium]
MLSGIKHSTRDWLTFVKRFSRFCAEHDRARIDHIADAFWSVDNKQAVIVGFGTRIQRILSIDQFRDDAAELMFERDSQVAAWLADFLSQQRVHIGTGTEVVTALVRVSNGRDESARNTLRETLDILKLNLRAIAATPPEALTRAQVWPWKSKTQTLSTVAKILAPLVRKSERTIKEWSVIDGWRGNSKRPNNRDVMVERDRVLDTLAEKGFL